MTRCKADQMAWINESDFPENVGIVVQTKEYGLAWGEKAWLCEANSPIKCWNYVGEIKQSAEFWIADANLTPINDPGLSVETTVEKTLEAV